MEESSTDHVSTSATATEHFISSFDARDIAWHHLASLGMLNVPRA